jgi:hypothetical protein
MEREPDQQADSDVAGTHAPETGSDDVSDPTAFAVDAELRRVFVPGTGWITAEAFWDIYYHRPDELPADLDHDALTAIRPASE